MAKRKSSRVSTKAHKQRSARAARIGTQTRAQPGKTGQPAKNKWVYAFGGGKAEGKAGMRELAGRQGRGPCRNGQSRPAGAARLHHHHRGLHPLLRQRAAPIRPSSNSRSKRRWPRVGRITGKSFGDRPNPLLVSVRSGARASMPGMMDTVLNLGLNDETVEALAQEVRRPPLRLRQLPALHHHVFRRGARRRPPAFRGNARRAQGAQRLHARHRSDRRGLGRNWSTATRSASRKSTARPFPQDPHEQLWGAIGAVFGSWMNQRAITYRRLHNIPESWGTAVNVQAMVFGNMGETLGDRRRLHAQSLDRREEALRRIPDQRPGRGRGRRHPHAAGDHRGRAQGIRLRQAVDGRGDAGGVHAELKRIYDTLERHYRDMQDLEFTVEQGKLWMLQTRNGKRTAKAALRIAVELANEKLITTRRGGDAHRSRRARPAAASDHRSARRAQGDRHRPAGVAGRGLRRDRVLLRRGGADSRPTAAR